LLSGLTINRRQSQEFGLDAEVNAQMAGAGVSVGGKGFATAGG
jgi:hypothetical protein